MSNRLLGNLARSLGFRRKINWYLRRINYTRTLRIHGVRIKAPSIYGIACRESESWMVDLLATLLDQRSGAFLDVGVNVGQTLVKVKAIDPGREYIGLEPNPVCVFYTQNLIKRNAFERCTLLPVGLFTHDSVLALDLFSEDATDSSASVISHFRKDSPVQSSVFVPVFHFDSLAKILGDTVVGVVKIDVEGAELEVIKSLLQLIRRDRPAILIEVLPVYSHDNTFRRERQDELETIFADAGYALLRVGKTGSGAYAGLELIEAIGIHSDLTRCDYWPSRANRWPTEKRGSNADQSRP
ncbi:FkbM family methyltransferase [Frateuria soli]|uniref:FkbM family methyltransferase n=1 Tax=Frateuria soli TaxID=1542730 RepID=UPI001E41BF3F|nr:FkbM family methyltransferase [Frateuria soli]UGB37691.1 FkbM family methyltransferase [Frateuria soli]